MFQLKKNWSNLLSELKSFDLNQPVRNKSNQMTVDVSIKPENGSVRLCDAMDSRWFSRQLSWQICPLEPLSQIPYNHSAFLLPGSWQSKGARYPMMQIWPTQSYASLARSLLKLGNCVKLHSDWLKACSHVTWPIQYVENFNLLLGNATLKMHSFPTWMSSVIVVMPGLPWANLRADAAGSRSL